MGSPALAQRTDEPGVSDFSDVSDVPKNENCYSLMTIVGIGEHRVHPNQRENAMRTTSQTRGRTIAGIAAAVALTIGVAACGSDDKKNDDVVPADSVLVVETEVPVGT